MMHGLKLITIYRLFFNDYRGLGSEYPPDKSKIIQHIFRHALTQTFSESFFNMFSYYLGVKCKGDIFDFFLRNPGKVYDIIADIYGEAAARYIFRSIYIYILRNTSIDVDFNLFLEYVKRGDHNWVNFIADVCRRFSKHLPKDRYKR